MSIGFVNCRIENSSFNYVNNSSNNFNLSIKINTNAQTEFENFSLLLNLKNFKQYSISDKNNLRSKNYKFSKDKSDLPYPNKTTFTPDTVFLADTVKISFNPIDNYTHKSLPHIEMQGSRETIILFNIQNIGNDTISFICSSGGGGLIPKGSNKEILLPNETAQVKYMYTNRHGQMNKTAIIRWRKIGLESISEINLTKIRLKGYKGFE